MRVGIVRMRVLQRFVNVRMHMRLVSRVVVAMVMLVVFVVPMTVGMSSVPVLMLVGMPFRQVGPNANPHQRRGRQHRRGGRLAEDDDRDADPDKRGGRSRTP
ncbi:MAG: hypothetical protein EXQ91_01270 [Alphaproteobacteria bacterium]|nr:hypothetical protein [Alphaproteobacteria bacterium]